MPLPCSKPGNTMEVPQRRNNDNGVNGSPLGEVTDAHGRPGRAQQALPSVIRLLLAVLGTYSRFLSGRRNTARVDKMRRIATWNVNTLFQDGKFENLLREAERMNLDAVGVSGVRWTGSGEKNIWWVDLVLLGRRGTQSWGGIVAEKRTGRGTYRMLAAV